jgi:hypothetical protein
MFRDYSSWAVGHSRVPRRGCAWHDVVIDHRVGARNQRTVADLLLRESQTTRHDPLVVLRLIYVMFSKLLVSRVVTVFTVSGARQ